MTFHFLLVALRGTITQLMEANLRVTNGIHLVLPMICIMVLLEAKMLVVMTCLVLLALIKELMIGSADRIRP
jgi:hypothetical protein